MPIGTLHRPENNHATWVALAFSVLLHVPLILLVGALNPDDEALASTNFDAQEEFSIDLVADNTEEAEEEKEEPEKEEDLQYVSLPAPEKEERPDEAKFADQHDETAEKEMVKKALPGAAKPPSPRPTPVKPPSEETPEEPTEDKPEEPTEETTEETEREETEDGVQARPEKQRASSPAPSPAEPQELFPQINDSQAAEMLGEGGSMDYLRDVSEGDKTLLNRKRTRYWAFFDRVKRQVSKQWSPVSEYRKRDPYGNVYGVKDRYSTVDVTLNGDGTVRRLYLSRASGLDFFDDEAVRAIQNAAPFHNPPEGLKDQDGLVHFTFGFYFEISSGQFRFIRVRN